MAFQTSIGSHREMNSSKLKLRISMRRGLKASIISLLFPLRLCMITSSLLYPFSSRPNVVSFSKILPRDDKLTQINLTPSNYNVNFEFLLPKLSKNLIPFTRMVARKPINNINRAITNDSIIYDNIDKFYQKNSKYKTYYHSFLLVIYLEYQHQTSAKIYPEVLIPIVCCLHSWM